LLVGVLTSTAGFSASYWVWVLNQITEMLLKLNLIYKAALDGLAELIHDVINA